MESHDATATLMKLWPWIEANRNKIVFGTIIVLLAVVVYSFVSWRHEQNQVAAGDALTQILIGGPAGGDAARLASSYLGVAEDYSGTSAGTRALLQGAAAQFVQGKYSDARDDFQRYLDAHPDDEFSGMAALGVAKCLEAEGKISDAMGAYQHVVNDFADPESVNRARFSMARLDMQQGRDTDALQLFQQVFQADPSGEIGGEARQYAFELVSRTPRQAPTARTPTSPSSFNLTH